MNQSDYLTDSEKIVAFLDGELDSAGTNSLFDSLGHHPELKEEMKQNVAISNSFKNSLIEPPPVLKEKILVRAGLAGAAVATTAGLWNRIFESRAFQLITTAFVASIATLFVANNLNDNQDSNFIGNRAKPEANISSSIKAQEPVVNFADFSKKNNTNIVSQVSNDEAPAFNEFADSPIVSTENEVADDFVGLTDASLRNSYNPRFRTQSNDYPERMNVFGSSFAEFLDNVSLQVRFANSMQHTKVDLKPINEPILNNFALAVVYDLNSNHGLALEIGQENFDQKYNGKEEGTPITWKQSYIAFWAGASYQYTYSNDSGFEPFGKVLLGGTRIGPLAKASIGVKYNMTSKLSSFVGLENTGLFYNYQDKWFSSYKTGLIGGLSLKF